MLGREPARYARFAIFLALLRPANPWATAQAVTAAVIARAGDVAVRRARGAKPYPGPGVVSFCVAPTRAVLSG